MLNAEKAFLSFFFKQMINFNRPNNHSKQMYTKKIEGNSIFAGQDFFCKTYIPQALFKPSSFTLLNEHTSISQ